MRKINTLLAVAALASLGACSKTKEGDIVVDKPVGIQTTPDTMHPPTVGMKVDSVSHLSVGTQKETLIVNKPVLKTTKTAVAVPTIKRKP